MALAWVQRADGRDDQRVGREAELAPHRQIVVWRRLKCIDVQADEIEVDQRLVGTGSSRGEFWRPIGELTRRTPFEVRPRRAMLMASDAVAENECTRSMWCSTISRRICRAACATARGDVISNGALTCVVPARCNSSTRLP